MVRAGSEANLRIGGRGYTPRSSETDGREKQVNCPYRVIATDRWPGVEISGTGRWALVAHKNGKAVAVYLTENESAAKASAPVYDSKVIDLRPCPVLDLPDTEEDRYEERLRARRERRDRFPL